jgi:GNAT superfamily N-acetyltransferase
VKHRTGSARSKIAAEIERDVAAWQRALPRDAVEARRNATAETVVEADVRDVERYADVSAVFARAHFQLAAHALSLTPALADDSFERAPDGVGSARVRARDAGASGQAGITTSAERWRPLVGLGSDSSAGIRSRRARRGRSGLRRARGRRLCDVLGALAAQDEKRRDQRGARAGANLGRMFRSARVEECAVLSNLAFRSKAIWGYSADFMEQCRGELTISADFLADNLLEVIELGGNVIGFYSLERISAAVAELGHLFVDPLLVRRGHGRRLLERAARTAYGLGFRTLRIQGDPNAEGFYQNAGARKVGTQPSASIPGRVLPVFELDLRERSSGHI